MSIGDNIKKFRIRKNLTQYELSCVLNQQGIDVGSSAISNWENNRTQPDPDTIVQLCKILEIDGNSLLGLSDLYVSTSKTRKIEKEFQEHHSLTDEEMKKVLEYIDFLKSKRS